MSTQTRIDDDAVMLETRIPESYRVPGLEYGAHVSGNGWSGYYVRPVDRYSDKWGVARLTPASDECYDTDEEIVGAIETELE